MLTLAGLERRIGPPLRCHVRLSTSCFFSGYHKHKSYQALLHLSQNCCRMHAVHNPYDCVHSCICNRITLYKYKHKLYECMQTYTKLYTCRLTYCTIDVYMTEICKGIHIRTPPLGQDNLVAVRTSYSNTYPDRYASKL